MIDSKKPDRLLKEGFDLTEQGKLDEAFEILQRIERKDSSELYAAAQLVIGNIFKQKGETRNTINYYQNINHNDSPKTYATAQLAIGSILKEEADIKEAIIAFRNVKHEDSPESYAIAQLAIGIILKEEKDNIEEAIKIFNNLIIHNTSPEIHALAQFNLGEIFKQQNKIKEAIDCYQKSSTHRYFISRINIRILEIENKNIRNILFDTESVISNLINDLKISPLFNDDEFKISHYTQASVAWEIIKKSSAFRLGLIKNVNDPMEGLTLHKFLQQSCSLPENIFNYIKKNDHLEYVFISCFTFNHDSLNQFRLYGKENNQEASGVSIVFPSNFFNIYSKDYIDNNVDIKDNKNPRFRKEQNNKKDESNRYLLNKQPLHRCIYLDPDTGYISLARRDKVTFYRELYTDGKNIKEISEEADNKWNNYISSITNKEEKIKEHLKNISCKIKTLSNIQGISEEEKRHIFETLHFILLPLQYLVKHAAFQEEQECRMIYITSLDNEKIQLDWESKQVYIEYEPEVKAHLDKIYLSPGALIYEDFFRHELDDPNNPKKRVRISSNPFRNR